MNDEQLKHGREISQKIEKAETQLYLWKNATKLPEANGGASINVRTTSQKGYTGDEWANVSPETFLVVKAINIDYWQKVVSDLKADFEKI